MAPQGENSDREDIEIEVKPKYSTDEEKRASRDSISKTFDSLKKNANVDSILNYAKNNTLDTIAYVLIFVGILWSIFQGFYGDLLVGLVAGFYFSKEIVNHVKNYNEFVQQQGLARSIICAATMFVLFISNPGVFIGAAIMAGIKMILRTDR